MWVKYRYDFCLEHSFIPVLVQSATPIVNSLPAPGVEGGGFREKHCGADVVVPCNKNPAP